MSNTMPALDPNNLRTEPPETSPNQESEAANAKTDVPPAPGTEAFDKSGLTPHDEHPLPTFMVFRPRRPIYDWNTSALGIMRGLLKRIDEWNEGGTTFWALVIEPGTPVFDQQENIVGMKPFVVPVLDPYTGQVVKTDRGHISVPLFEPPDELRSRLDNAYWAVMEVRRHPKGQWVFLFSKKRFPKKIA